MAQFEGAILAGELEIVDALFAAFAAVHDANVSASYDWPIGIASTMAAAAIELGDPSAEMWIEHAEQAAARAGSVLEQALLHVHRARNAFMTGGGGQDELDQSRLALETLDGLGAPLLARLHRERLTSVAGRVGMPSGRIRTVMFTDIVDSTRLMASAGNAGVGGDPRRASPHRSRCGRKVRGLDHDLDRRRVLLVVRESQRCRRSGESAPPSHRARLPGVAGGVVAVRVGLASGSVFDLGGDASGLAVAEAARVMATATTGQTHVSQSVIDHGLDIQVGRSLGMHSLKGLPTPIEVFELAQQPAT